MVSSLCDGFMNCTQSIGLIVQQASLNVSGSLFLTLGMVLILLIAACILFRIPLEFTAVIIIPLVLVYMAYDPTHFIIVGVALFFYLALIFTKNFIFR